MFLHTAHFIHSAFIAAKVLCLDDARTTAAHLHNDGHNFHPTHRWVLFGHHFAAITGAGPLIGPVLAAQFGCYPGFLWILFGVVLAGGVHDFVILVASARRGGRSLAEIAREELGPTLGLVTAISILFIIVIALAGLGNVVDELGQEDAEFVAMMKARPNVILVPNLPDRGVATDLGWLRGRVTDGELQKLQAAAVDRPAAQQAFAIQARNLAALSKAGVRIALGTDGNTPWGPHLEMADMVATGMSPAQVIVAATKNGAEFLRIPDAGTVASGMSADFVVLEANPLDDITNTRRIRDVYLRGERVDRSTY